MNSYEEKNGKKMSLIKFVLQIHFSPKYAFQFVKCNELIWFVNKSHNFMVLQNISSFCLEFTAKRRKKTNLKSDKIRKRFMFSHEFLYKMSHQINKPVYVFVGLFALFTQHPMLFTIVFTVSFCSSYERKNTVVLSVKL